VLDEVQQLLAASDGPLAALLALREQVGLSSQWLSAQQLSIEARPTLWTKRPSDSSSCKPFETPLTIAVQPLGCSLVLNAHTRAHPLPCCMLLLPGVSVHRPA
jgi:hypothetical protein